MRTRQKRKTWLGRLIVPAITISVLGYFSMQVQTGKYGLEAKAELAEILVKRQAEYERLSGERQAMERRVELLSDGTLEWDIVDERVRQTLNMSTEDEIVILR